MEEEQKIIRKIRRFLSKNDMSEDGEKYVLNLLKNINITDTKFNLKYLLQIHFLKRILYNDIFFDFLINNNYNFDDINLNDVYDNIFFRPSTEKLFFIKKIIKNNIIFNIIDISFNFNDLLLNYSYIKNYIYTMSKYYNYGGNIYYFYDFNPNNVLNDILNNLINFYNLSYDLWKEIITQNYFYKITDKPLVKNINNYMLNECYKCSKIL